MIKLKPKGILCKIHDDFISYMMDSTYDKKAILNYCNEKINLLCPEDGVFIDVNNFIIDCLFIPRTDCHSQAGWDDYEEQTIKESSSDSE